MKKPRAASELGRVRGARTAAQRLDALDWDALAGELDELGCAVTRPLLSL